MIPNLAYVFNDRFETRRAGNSLKLPVLSIVQVSFLSEVACCARVATCSGARATLHKARQPRWFTFYFKVSSESGFDYLKFYVDGEEKDKWSGEQDWAEVSFPVNEGTRAFAWTYSKDGLASDGDDAAWIDDISFPVDGTSPVDPDPAISTPVGQHES